MTEISLLKLALFHAESVRRWTGNLLLIPCSCLLRSMLKYVLYFHLSLQLALSVDCGLSFLPPQARISKTNAQHKYMAEGDPKGNVERAIIFNYLETYWTKSGEMYCQECCRFSHIVFSILSSGFL